MKNEIGRLAIILPDLRGGGAERISVSLAAALIKLGCQIDFVLMRKQGALIAELPAGVRLVDLKAPRIRSALKPLTAYFRDERPAGAITNMWPLTSVAVLARLRSRVPTRLAVCEHNTLSVSYSQKGKLHKAALALSIRTSYPLADARIAVSSGAADDLAKLTMLRRNSISVVHNPIPSPATVDTAMLTAADAVWKGAPWGQRVLSVGSLKRQKNHTLLMRAFAGMSELPQSHLLILGEGPLRVELEQLSLQLGVASRVIFAGFHSDPTPFYQTADLFVLSSDYEGFGNVIVEAMACGLPVLCTDCPSGPAEILDNGKFGRLVPVNNVDALATAMAEELSKEHDCERLKARALDFAPEKAAARYLELLFADKH